MDKDSKPEENNQDEANDHKQNQPEAGQNLKENESEEYKPFNNGYNSPLSSPVIREKIETVLRFASTPLVEDGTPEFLLYQSWHTPSPDPVLPPDFFTVERVQRRERFSPFSPQWFVKYLPVTSGRYISHHPAQFHSFTSNLNSSLLGTLSVTPTSHLFAPILSSSLFGTSPVTFISHLLPGCPQSNLRNIKLSKPTETCGYCIATCEFPQNHNKKECPKLACMKPCKLCNASGSGNHTLMHCPHKEKVVLKLKRDKRNNIDKDNTDNENAKNYKNNKGNLNDKDNKDNKNDNNKKDG